MIRLWWQGLADRERLLSILALVFGLLVVVYLLLWQPLQQGSQELQQQQTQQQQQLRWLQQSLQDVAALRAQNAAGGSMQQRVNQLAALEAIQITRWQPGNNELSVNLDTVAFTALINWLARLQQAGIWLQQINLEQLATPGQVKARLVLREAQ